MRAPRPNFVIFNPDQWRGDVLGHLGNAAVVTPNLDRLVTTEAVSFLLFGGLVQALRQPGVYDDTAIFFLSDHGDYTGDYGLVKKNQNTFEDCLSRVPLVIKPPRQVPAPSRTSDELYGLRSDPAETRNLITDPAHAATVARLRQRMLTWFLETGDVVPWEEDRR